METQVRTPQMVFMQPQRLIVPLFQRPYVWNQESQWEPLWDDVVRVAKRVLARPQDRHQPHFLGAVVLQQVQNPLGMMQQWTIIDGQQRLTTLQLLLDALRLEVKAFDEQASTRIEALVTNPGAFCSKPEDRFKVWPTNRDRASFNAAMSVVPNTGVSETQQKNERMTDAHHFFREQARQWLFLDESIDHASRARAIETVVRDLLQMVVIDLSAEENAQEIFETLNARGAQLTAADLIKNFIFQGLLEAGSNVEEAYERDWKEFETSFWEKSISVGRMSHPRSSIFLNHWLIARTGDEVVAKDVFAQFKSFAYDAELPMGTLLQEIQRAASVYRSFIMSASMTGPIDRLGLFGYRTGVLESEVIKPFVLYLLDPELDPIPETQLVKALGVAESWMVRRMLLRAATKSYSQIVAEMITLLREGDRSAAGDVIERFLAGQTSAGGYWPDNAEIRGELQNLLAYRRLSRGRLRMILEAVEDYQRGWKDGKSGLGGERVARGSYEIEHVMPRQWTAHWPLDAGPAAEGERDRLIHTIGNLTLLTGKLNSKVSNGPWLGTGGKREGLEGHDVLVLNRELLKSAGSGWSEATIQARTQQLAEAIIRVWPVPENHRSSFSEDKPRRRKTVHLSDLINGGVLAPGMLLYPRSKKFSDKIVTLLPDGRLEVNGSPYESPSEAAVAVSGSRTNGWWFFLVDEKTRRSLRSVRRDYINDMAVDAEDDDDDDGGDGDKSYPRDR